jgi:GxxExxY protein
MLRPWAAARGCAGRPPTGSVEGLSSQPIPHQDLTYRIIGAAMSVQRRLPPGLRERHYQEALTHEMVQAGLSVAQDFHLEVYDGETWLGRLYLDHLVNEAGIVEDKAVAHSMGNGEIAQVIAYLAAMNLKAGLLLNFGRRRLEVKRILPPRALAGWQKPIAKYLWKPDTAR